MSLLRHGTVSGIVVVTAMVIMIAGLAIPLCMGTTMMQGCPMSSAVSQMSHSGLGVAEAMPTTDCHGMAKQSMDCCDIDPSEGPIVVASLADPVATSSPQAELPMAQPNRPNRLLANTDVSLIPSINHPHLYSSLLL